MRRLHFLFIAFLFATISLPSSQCFAQDSSEEHESDGASSVTTGDEESSEEPPTVTASPETKKEQSVIRYAAVVQFVQGANERIDARRMRVALDFKMPIYEGERLVIGEGALLKFLTRNECIGVIYGGAQALSPEMEKQWRIRGPAVRWICPPGKQEKINVRGAHFTIGGESGGEILIDGRRVLVLTGQVEAFNTAGALPIMKTLVPSGKVWAPEKPERAPLALWNFNQSHKPPQESFQFTKPPPPPAKAIIRTSRWIFGPSGGGAGASFDNNDLNQNDVGINGGRLQSQWKKGNGSLVVLFEFSDFGHKNDSGTQFNSPELKINGSSNSLQFGYRFQHLRWWSPFVRGGFGIDKPRFSIHKNAGGPNNYNADIEYEFYMINASTGIDAYYAPGWPGWLGLYGGLDFNVARSIGRGGRFSRNENVNGEVPSIASEPWAMTRFTIQLSIGLLLQF